VASGHLGDVGSGSCEETASLGSSTPTFSAFLRLALDTGDRRPLQQFLKSDPSVDPFALLLSDTSAVDRLLAPYGSSLASWLTGADGWAGRPESTIEELILCELWDVFQDAVVTQLNRVRASLGLPVYGGILAFVGDLALCVVLEYDASGGLPSLSPVAVVEAPRSVFGLWESSNRLDARARNSLKRILLTGHKLIWHRGVLLHIDGRSESDVFGPSIETIMLADVLWNNLGLAGRNRQRTSRPIRVAMEVGCGNGLLSVSLARFLRSLQEMFVIDYSFSAIACTAKNLRLAGISIADGGRPVVHLLASKFDPTVFNRRFDLIVCNPPYIPFPPGDFDQRPNLGWPNAVGGLELAIELASNLDRLLTEEGHLLLMTSNLSRDMILGVLPSDMEVLPAVRSVQDAGGLEVDFDVEAVLKRERWLYFLQDQCGLAARADGSFFHRLLPLWIRRSGGASDLRSSFPHWR
jgi:methylase of polypeptide subunit release factors